MKELLLKIRALLAAFCGDGRQEPLCAPAAVALGLMEQGDLLAVKSGILPPDGVDGHVQPLPADAGEACGAAFACKWKNHGGVVAAAVSDGQTLNEALTMASALNLPLVLLMSCQAAALDEISSQVMAMDVECIPADGRDVMALMPALRLAVDKAREGDGPTVIECVADQLPDDDDTPLDPLARLDRVLVLEGYAMPEDFA